MLQYSQSIENVYFVSYKIGFKVLSGSFFQNWIITPRSWNMTFSLVSFCAVFPVVIGALSCWLGSNHNCCRHSKYSPCVMNMMNSCYFLHYSCVTMSMDWKMNWVSFHAINAFYFVALSSSLLYATIFFLLFFFLPQCTPSSLLPPPSIYPDFFLSFLFFFFSFNFSFTIIHSSLPLYFFLIF